MLPLLYLLFFKMTPQFTKPYLRFLLCWTNAFSWRALTVWDAFTAKVVIPDITAKTFICLKIKPNIVRIRFFSRQIFLGFSLDWIRTHTFDTLQHQSLIPISSSLTIRTHPLYIYYYKQIQTKPICEAPNSSKDDNTITSLYLLLNWKHCDLNKTLKTEVLNIQINYVVHELSKFVFYHIMWRAEYKTRNT